MNENLICVARFTAKDGRLDDLKRALSALVPLTRQEEGCISYALHADLQDPNILTMIERFRDRDAFDLHSQSPYLQDFLKIAGTLAETIQVNLYGEI